MQNPLLFPYRMWDMETIYFYLKPGVMNVTVTPMQCQWAVNVLFPHLVTAGSPSSLPSAFKRAANASEETLLVSGISPSHQPMSVCCIPTQHAQLCPTLCDPMDCSPPGSSIHGILQAKVLEWVAISFSRGMFPTQGSHPGLSHCRQMLYHLSHQNLTIYH